MPSKSKNIAAWQRDAVAVALRFARSEMPEASDARLLLLIIGHVAACLGRLRVRSQDVVTIAWGFYEQGSELPMLDLMATPQDFRLMTSSPETGLAERFNITQLPKRDTRSSSSAKSRNKHASRQFFPPPGGSAGLLTAAV